MESKTGPQCSEGRGRNHSTVGWAWADFLPSAIVNIFFFHYFVRSGKIFVILSLNRYNKEQSYG
jgi:hypothetical protein